MSNTNNSTTFGTVGGTFTSVLPNLSSEDVAKTIVLATVGALVSFAISVFLKYLQKKYKKNS